MGLNIEASADVLGNNHSHSFFFYSNEKYTLLPKDYFEASCCREYLVDLFHISATEQVDYVEIPEYNLVLVYSSSGDISVSEKDENLQSFPIVYLMLSLLPKIKNYNKLIVNFTASDFSVVLAQGDQLLLANTYDLSDVMTAAYYLFVCLKRFAINPELTKIFVVGECPADFEGQMSKYFSGVKEINFK